MSRETVLEKPLDIPDRVGEVENTRSSAADSRHPNQAAMPREPNYFLSETDLHLHQSFTADNITSHY